MAPAIAPARVAAFDVIRRVFEDEAYADRALRKATAGLDDRDRALARQLAYGTVQRARTLDHAIEIAGRRPVGRLDAAVRAALRLGAYQLVFLDGVPRYAAVNESVELVRRAGLERAVPFANAVLRRLADEGRSGVEALPDSTWEEAAVAHSYPDWVAETWWRDLGADGALALMRAQNVAPATVVRLVAWRDRRRCPIRTSPEPGTSSTSTRPRSPRAACGRRAPAPSSPVSRSASVAGERVLDLCAAPGGKATMLAGEVVAVEVERRPRPRARGERRAARGDERPGRLRRRPRAAGGADGIRPRARRRSLLGARRPRGTARSPLALAAAAGAPARAAAGGRRARSPGRHRPLLRLHRQPRRGRGGRRRLRARGRRHPRRGLAAVPPPPRPEFLQTLPHVHGTSGFFIARLAACP